MSYTKDEVLMPGIGVQGVRELQVLIGVSRGLGGSDIYAVIARSSCDEAIQIASAARFWIASLRSQ